MPVEYRSLLQNIITDPHLPGGHYYSLFLCLFQYFIPVAIMVYCYAMVAKTMWKSRNTLSMRDPPIAAKFNKSVTATNSFSSTNNSFRYKNSARTASMTKGGQKVCPCYA